MWEVIVINIANQDPRRLEASEPKTLSFRQYQTFAQSLGAYKRQIQAMSAATEVFVRALQDLADCVPQANIQDPLLISDLDFLIDSSQLMSNAHQNWASLLEQEAEEPLLSSIAQIPIEAKQIQESNKLKIQERIKLLHQEEDFSYKMKKQKHRNLDRIQSSLNNRMKLAEEIKRLSFQNDHIQDIKSQEKVPFILNTITRVVEANLEAFETIQEGFQKIGTSMDEAALESSHSDSFNSKAKPELLPPKNYSKEGGKDFVIQEIDH